MENTNTIIDIAHQELDTYSVELASLIALKELEKRPINTYELVSARQRMSRLIEAIDKLIDEEE